MSLILQRSMRGQTGIESHLIMVSVNSCHQVALGVDPSEVLTCVSVGSAWEMHACCACYAQEIH